MGSNDLITLFFVVAAVLIFLQLRSVLGRRTGNEKPPRDLYSPRDAAAPENDAGKVVTLPKRDQASEEEDRFAVIDAVAPEGSPLNAQLRQLRASDPSFNPKDFIQGAKMAYEMIVTAYASGDRKSLRNLLSRDVFEGFDAAISEREARGETLKSTFVGIEKAEIIQAEVKGSEAHIVLRILSQLVSATYDKDGKLIEGDADNVAEVNDVWTFARDTRSRDPNWKLVATESDS